GEIRRSPLTYPSWTSAGTAILWRASRLTNWRANSFVSLGRWNVATAPMADRWPTGVRIEESGGDVAPRHDWSGRRSKARFLWFCDQFLLLGGGINRRSSKSSRAAKPDMRHSSIILAALVSNLSYSEGISMPKRWQSARTSW